MNRNDRPSLEQIEKELARRDKLGRYAKSLRVTLAVLIVVVAAAVLLATFFIPVLRVSGTSMTPMLSQGDIVVSFKTDKFECGEIAAFYYNNKILLKRVVAGGGDWVDFDSEGNLYVNNVKIDEPYAVDIGEGETNIEYPFQVPENSWFVLGDHRSTSIDSRCSQIGCISNEDMIGKIVLRVYPFGKITVF